MLEDLILSAGTEAVEIRRHLHQHPEVSEHEYETMRLISGKMDDWGIPHQTGVADTGVVGVIKGKYPGPVIGLRADIDALPIQEENSHLPYCSVNKGVSHACGHDAHTAILLGVAKVLNGMRNELHGTVKLFFQPAEESIGGAERMIEAGCMENPRVDYTLGLHVDTDFLTGQIGVKNGKMFAASDMMRVEITGKACHGAYPHNGTDAILMAAAVIQNVQSIVSRNVSANDAAVITFGTIHGGNVMNQVAEKVELTGIIRTLDPETRKFARERIRNVIENTAKAFGGEAKITFIPSYCSLINDDTVAEVVRETGRRLLGAENVIEIKEPSMGVDDFAYFAAAAPGTYFMLGCRKDRNAEMLHAHTSRFDVDDGCVPVGIRLQVENVLRLMGEGK